MASQITLTPISFSFRDNTRDPLALLKTNKFFSNQFSSDYGRVPSEEMACKPMRVFQF
jgi:hypothetical protein